MPCRLKFYSTPRDFPPSRLDAQFCLIKLLKYRVARLKIGRYVGQSLVWEVGREGGSDFIKADRKFCIAFDAGPSVLRRGPWLTLLTLLSIACEGRGRRAPPAAPLMLPASAVILSKFLSGGCNSGPGLRVITGCLPRRPVVVL